MRPVGVDLSFGMLAAARTDAPLVQGDALRLPVPDASVDGVTCGFALRNLVALEPFFAAEFELLLLCRSRDLAADVSAEQVPNALAFIALVRSNQPGDPNEQDQ